MANDTCPPCNHNCRQGRDCPARKKTMPAPTDLAAALLRDVPICGRIYTGGNCLDELVCKKDVLAALSAHLDGVTERAGEVLEGVTPGPWFFGRTGEEQRLILGGTSRKKYVANVHIFQTPRHMGAWDEPEREANARFIAWCREGVPALLAQNAALRAELDEHAEALKVNNAVLCAALLRAVAAEAEVEKLRDALRSIEHLTENDRIRGIARAALTTEADNEPS